MCDFSFFHNLPSAQLAGYELQTEHPTDVEGAINQLKIIAEEQNIQTKRLIDSVVEMFFNNWGRKDREFDSALSCMSSLLSLLFLCVLFHRSGR